MQRYFLTMALLLMAVASAAAQEVVWSVDFNSVLNNREGGDEMRPDQTFIFTRLTPEVGLQVKTDSANAHRLMGGATWLQPLNNSMDGYKVLPVLYYQWARTSGNDALRVSVGWVPRTQLMEREPRYLWSDSLSYHQPSIRGALVQYVHGRSYGELFIDWRQMQTQHRREAFNAALDGKWYVAGNPRWWLGGWAQYNHLAKRKNAPEGEGVNDDITLNPMLGCDLDWSNTAWRLKAGAVINRERARIDSKWHTPCGFVAAANVRWRFLEIDENIFAGKDLFPLYERFGSELNLGDTYYRDKFYSRTDVTAHIVQNRFVDLKAQLSLHATDQTTGFWQQISCRFYFDSNLWKHRRNRAYLKSGRLESTY